VILKLFILGMVKLTF